MGDDHAESQSQLVVTNYWSRDFCRRRCTTIGSCSGHTTAEPTSISCSRDLGLKSWKADGWKAKMRFQDGSEFKPRTIPVPFGFLPREGAHLFEGGIDWVDMKEIASECSDSWW
ncbi:hypothetical protein CKALI_00305 [Corynebacterium kalinowskii]|uniref:Uncharacterized protein n=1 Tax=Corynebacterium kalinowskii TaxID=2675216 RepID=A0A6B8V762_9CORY|nr:hypothetical protein CKALI_00305 [Corynebacterium kalinowskii]